MKSLLRQICKTKEGGEEEDEGGGKGGGESPRYLE